MQRVNNGNAHPRQLQQAPLPLAQAIAHVAFKHNIAASV